MIDYEIININGNVVIKKTTIINIVVSKIKGLVKGE